MWGSEMRLGSLTLQARANVKLHATTENATKSLLETLDAENCGYLLFGRELKVNQGTFEENAKTTNLKMFGSEMISAAIKDVNMVRK